MQEPMTDRERVRAIFRKQRIDRVVWQPRISHWYNMNLARIMGQPVTGPETTYPLIPQDLRGASRPDCYRRLGCSMRYPAEIIGQSMFGMRLEETAIRVRGEQVGANWVTSIETPAGNLRSVSHAGYHSEYLLKGPGDFAAYRHVLEHQKFFFNPEGYAAAEREFGDDGVPSEFFPRAPLQRLIIELMGFEAAIDSLYEHPEETIALMDDIAQWDDAMYEVLAASPVEILNFGENLDGVLDSPRLFQQYLLPYYQRRSAQLRASGKFVFVHADGALKPLLKVLPLVGFDGIEAATPLPQGDVTLEEIREMLGDAVLLDGIPAVHFLPLYSLDELERTTGKVLDLFSPWLILGASDEVPPGSDISRVRFVRQIVDSYTPSVQRA